MPVNRDGLAVVVGRAPHEQKSDHPDEASAERAFEKEVAVLRKKGFVTLDEHRRMKAGKTPLFANEPDRRRLLRDGERFGETTLDVKKLASLTVSSGQIIACDPLSSSSPKPFAARVPKGTYDVYVALAGFPFKKGKKTGIDVRCAAAFVRFAKGAVVRFEPANMEPRKRGAKPSSVYGVDAGTGCFLDANETKILAIESAMDDVVSQLLSKKHPPTFGSAVVKTKDGIGNALVAFSSGFGDGAYACFWGFDKAKKRVCLLTDFAIVDTTKR